MEPTPRDRLITTASNLFQTQGYNSTGLNQIITESATPKGSLYHYFPGGKEDLAVAAINFAANEIDVALQQQLTAQPGLQEGLTAVLQFFMHELESSGFKKGCPVATIALEQAGHSSKIQAACGMAYARWENSVTLLLQAHGIAEPAVGAARLMNALEGALVLSRARANTAPLKQVIKDLPLLCALKR